MFDEIKRTLALNKTEVAFVGKKYFHSKPKVIMSFITNLFFFGVAIFVFLIPNLTYSLLAFIIASLSIWRLLSFSLPTLFYKHPIYILNDKQLYYSKTQRWYDLETCHVASYYGSFSNYFGTLYIKDAESELVVEEENWFVHHSDDLIDKIQRIRKVESLFGYK